MAKQLQAERSAAKSNAASSGGGGACGWGGGGAARASASFGLRMRSAGGANVARISDGSSEGSEAALGSFRAAADSSGMDSVFGSAHGTAAAALAAAAAAAVAE
eukprot:194143-Chlamydomonas_euryale.AAC.1